MRGHCPRAVCFLLGLVPLSCGGVPADSATPGVASANDPEPPPDAPPQGGKLRAPGGTARLRPSPRDIPHAADVHDRDASVEGTIPDGVKKPGHGLKPGKPSHTPPPLNVPKPVACGSATCDPVPLPGSGIVLRSCCADAVAGTCGIATGPEPTASCIAGNQSALPNPNCADGTFAQVPGIALKGCCAKSKCGYIVAIPGGPSLGCVDAATLGQSRASVACR